MKTYKDRYRRLPIELILSPYYEALPSDAKLVYLTLIISPRQNQAGIYDGGMRSLVYETALDDKRLKVAVGEIEKAGLIETIKGGGWWIKDTYRWQVSNEQFERAALRLLAEKWPAILPKFEAYNAGILGRKDEKNKGGSHPPSNPRPTGGPISYRSTDLQVSDLQIQKTDLQISDAGGRGHAEEGGIADALAGAFTPPLAPALPQEAEKGNGEATPKGKPDWRNTLAYMSGEINAGRLTLKQAKKGLRMLGAPEADLAEIFPEEATQ